MLGLSLSAGSEPLRRVLAIGCHADDIEIGCGGAFLSLTAAPGPDMRGSTWVVLAASGEREREARASAEAFLAAAAAPSVEVHGFRDAYLPYVGGELKAVFDELGARIDPQLVFTHTRDDLHQDHRLACELTWNTFRDQLILEYEIPKFDGDLGRPNVFMPLSETVVEQKVELLQQPLSHPEPEASGSTADRHSAVSMRLRGIEANAPDRFAEAFTCRKLPLAP